MHLVSFCHCSIKFKVITPVQSASLPAHELRDFDNADWSSITSSFISVVFDFDTASECADAFYAELNTAINLSVSLKIFRSAKTNKTSVILNIFVSSMEPSLLLGGDINVSEHSNCTRNINVEVHAVEMQFTRILP